MEETAILPLPGDAREKAMSGEQAQLPHPALSSFGGVSRGALKALVMSGLRRVSARLRPATASRVSVRGIRVPVRTPVRVHLPEPAEIYQGVFALAGRRVESRGRVVFDLPETDTDWLAALHGFSWLTALLREDMQLWRVLARTLVADWARRRRHHPAIADAPLVAAERLTMLVTLAPALLEGATRAQEDALFRLLGGEFRRLKGILPLVPLPHERLFVLLALSTAALSLEGLQAQLAPLSRQLAREADAQILPDGAHISRSPALLLEIVARMQPLLEAWSRAGDPLPEALDAALQRALPMLRFIRMGDGGLALFQGVSDPAPGQLAAVLDADSVMASPLCHATHAGFVRLEAGRAVLLADVGRPAPATVNADAALSTLALEFSYGAHRIITGCGAPRIPSPQWRRATRFTAAHSAPTLDDRDAGRLTGGYLARHFLGGESARGPENVSANVTRSDSGSLLEAEHDAWSGRHGLACRRRLYLSPDGRDLRGEDALLPVAEGRAPRSGETFVIRFHLHPAVQPTLSRDGASVLLVLPDRSVWRFTARGADMSLEESVHLAAETGLRRTRQIVLRAPVSERGAQVSWKLSGQPVAARPHRRQQAEGTPALPF